MSVPPQTTIASIPPYNPSSSNAPHHHASDSDSSTTSSLSSSSSTTHNTALPHRPQPGPRKRSTSMIIPRDNPDVELKDETYPPDDARAMSPRRSISDTARLGDEARASVKRQARSLQSGLNALAERIEQVKADHEKLEKQNLALQDYIGGLTRSMSGGSSGGGGGGGGKGRK